MKILRLRSTAIPPLLLLSALVGALPICHTLATVNEGCSIQNHTLEGDVELAEYVPVRVERSILVIPPTGGENFLDRGLAAYLCRNNARTVIARSWSGNDEPLTQFDLKRHDRLTERAIHVLRKVLDWMGNRQVGVVGASLGGMYASYLASMDRRVTATLMVAAGGPSSEVLAYWDQSILNHLRKVRTEAFGYTTIDEYQQALEKALEWDLAKLAQPEQRDRVAMIIANADTTVPSAQQWKLHQAWGAPAHLKVVSQGHVFGIFRAYQFERAWIRDWFRSRLAAE
jgi:dienelactone hydrolase